MGAVPKDEHGVPRLLVLDLIADFPSGGALWSQDNGTLLAGAPSIWCALNNWGGAVHIGGDIGYVLQATDAAFRSTGSPVVGVGLTMEGIDNNPFYFQTVLDTPWLDGQATTDSLLDGWASQRCGQHSDAAADAYALLGKTVYRPNVPYLWCCRSV